MEEDSTRAPTEMFTLDYLRITRRKAMVSRNGLQVQVTRVPGSTIRCMEKAPSSGLKVISIKVSIRPA